MPRVEGARGPACGPICSVEKGYMADRVGMELEQRLRPGNWEIIATVQARDFWLGLIEPTYGSFGPVYFPSLRQVIGPVFHSIPTPNPGRGLLDTCSDQNSSREEDGSQFLARCRDPGRAPHQGCGHASALAVQQGQGSGGLSPASSAGAGDAG